MLRLSIAMILRDSAITFSLSIVDMLKQFLTISTNKLIENKVELFSKYLDENVSFTMKYDNATHLHFRIAGKKQVCLVLTQKRTMGNPVSNILTKISRTVLV